MTEPSIENLLAPFKQTGSLEARYSLLLKLARQAPKLNAHWQQEQYLVSGCEANVWLIKTEQGFIAGSDSRLLHAIVYIICTAANDCGHIDTLDVQGLLDQLRLGHFISSSRSNGLKSIEKAIKQWR